MKTEKRIAHEDLISTREAANMLQVEPRTIGNYREMGKIGCVYISRRKILYSRPDILLLIQRGWKPPTEQPLLFSLES